MFVLVGCYAVLIGGYRLFEMTYFPTSRGKSPTHRPSGHIFLSCILNGNLHKFIALPCTPHIASIIIGITVQRNKSLSFILLSFLQSAATSFFLSPISSPLPLPTSKSNFCLLPHPASKSNLQSAATFSF